MLAGTLNKTHPYPCSFSLGHKKKGSFSIGEPAFSFLEPVQT